MENSARRLTGEGSEEPIMSAAASPSATSDSTSSFHIALEACHLSSVDEVALGDGSGAGSSVEPKSEYFSARVEEMMRSKSQFSSPVEHEIEYSKAHWSDVSGLSNYSEENDDYEEVNRENEKVLAELISDPQWKHHTLGAFFRKYPFHARLGGKIAEGGQAEIFEVINTVDDIEEFNYIWKVFKRGSCLSDLRKQWPHGILRREVQCVVHCGFMLNDGRFVFQMLRCWGDLRKLIDQAMQENNNQGPPFPYNWSGRILHVEEIIRKIAYQMDWLHKHGILHRDLKAANILLRENNYDNILFVADFECSIGVVGTGFWRAPEILLALKNRSAIDFSEKMDVYSYGMTCFEIVTGRLPFEGELEVCRASHDLIVGGQRPKLPSDLDVTLRDLIERCWNPNPNERPSFSKIVEVLNFRYSTIEGNAQLHVVYGSPMDFE